MGDVRFDPAYERLAQSTDRAATIRDLSDAEVIGALAAVATHEQDPYLSNVLATEAQNRMQRTGTTLAHLGEGVVAVDEEGRVTLANPAACQLLGWSEDDLVGRDLHETTHSRRPDGSTLPAAECDILKPLRAPVEHARGETSLVRRDGSFLAVEWTSAALCRDGEVVGVVVIFRDVTESQRRQLELARRAAELEAVVHSIHDAVYIGDASGIKMANPAALEMLGFRSVEELNRNIAELSVRLNNRNPKTGAKISAEDEPFARALGGTPVVEEVLSTNLITGKDVLLRCAAAPIRLGSDIIGAVAVNTRLDGRGPPEA